MNNFKTNQISIPEISRDEDFQNKFLLFKTNTTGLPQKWNAPIADVDNWPRVVQLAWILINKKGNTIDSNDFIIFPDDYKIPFDAAMIHGISTKRAMNEGVPLESVLSILKDLLHDVEFVVTYNNFDWQVIAAEYYRKNLPTPLILKKKLNIMSLATDFCKLSGPYGYKFPKLSELYYSLFAKNYSMNHDTLIDLRAIEKCFREMQRRKII